MITITEEELKIAIECIKLIQDKYDRDYSALIDSLEEKLCTVPIVQPS